MEFREDQQKHREAVSALLVKDRGHIDQATIFIDYALAELQKLSALSPVASAYRHKLYLIQQILEWQSGFLNEETINPESVFIHNLANFID